jgi:hypothetical protein
MKTAILFVLVLTMSFGAVSAAELSLDRGFPVVGEDEDVALVDAEPGRDLSLWVVYSPNSETRSEEMIGRLSSEATVTWNPSRFGIATLSVRGATGEVIASRNVAVLYARTPMAGLLVMVFAGVLLFGGAGLSLRSVLKSGTPHNRPLIDT